MYPQASNPEDFSKWDWEGDDFRGTTSILKLTSNEMVAFELCLPVTVNQLKRLRFRKVR